MASRHDRTQAVETQGGHSNRDCVVGVVLVRTAGGQHTSSSSEGGWYVEHRFTGGDELLREQIAESVGGLDRPRSRAQRRSPTQELFDLCGRRSNPLAGQFHFAAINGNRCVSRLMRVDSDHHVHDAPSGSSDGNRGGHSCFWMVRARSSFEPHRGEALRECCSFGSQTRRDDGRQALREHPRRAPERYEPVATPARSLKQAH